nr:MAG TPA: hypothetical protein [Caudoviricetes sp.]DAI24147.1 MAG TPA: hypothetical protein [Caudoviricetes sp.]DAQ40698.1 MAG TPA: hypothetical protein [Caudoviricetes sp.]
MISRNKSNLRRQRQRPASGVSKSKLEVESSA